MSLPYELNVNQFVLQTPKTLFGNPSPFDVLYSDALLLVITVMRSKSIF